MRIENSSKRLMLNHENGEQREGKQVFRVRNKVNTENREQKEKKMLMQSELRIELKKIEKKSAKHENGEQHGQKVHCAEN